MVNKCKLVFSHKFSEVIGDEDEEMTIPEHYKLELTCDQARVTHRKQFAPNDTTNISDIKKDLKNLNIIIVHPTPERPITKDITYDEYNALVKKYNLEPLYYGGSRRHRPSRKYKKSAKRVFRKKSRSTRRR